MMEGCTIGDCESIGLKTFELKKLQDSWHLLVSKQQAYLGCPLFYSQWIYKVLLKVTPIHLS